MAATLIGEAYLSRSRSGQTLDLVYLYQGTDDGDEVRDAVIALNVTTFDGLSRQANEITVEPMHAESGDGIWVVRVPYAVNEWSFNTGADSYFFDTSGGTARITHSREVTQSLAVTGTPPNIGTTKGGPIGRDGEGVDVPVPQFEWEETHIFSSGDITTAYKDRLAELTGKVNNASFTTTANGHGDEGELLFLGARGGRLPDNTFAISFRFAKSKNTTGSSGGGIEIGPDMEVQKEGWEYIDVWFEDVELPGSSTENKIIGKKPKFVYVHRIFNKDDFSDLGIS